MKKSSSIRVVHAGLGPIGRAIAAALLDVPGVDLVGAVDIDSSIAGQPLSELVPHPNAPKVKVRDTMAAALKRDEPTMVTQTTGSHMPEVFDSLMEIISAGVSVVSTAEELLYPWHRSPSRATALHAAAKSSGARVLGTGINPGFLMDLLPIVLSAPSRSIRGVRAERVVDVATRRGPLQKKVGAGLSIEEFRERVQAGRLGHVGLQESAMLVARKLCWELASIHETIEPVVAERKMQTEHVSVARGAAAGVHQIARGHTGDGRIIELNLKMCLGADDPHDAVRIDGEPPIDLRIHGGIAGDSATISCVVSAIPRLMLLPPGLWTVADLPASAVPNSAAP
jgi:4-hydroxy-tetrahydrodipicolinate reductase